MAALKLTQIGNSVGVVLPKEILARLKLAKGDTVFVTDSADGIRLSPYDPGFEAQMTAARRIMKKRRDVLRESAKCTRPGCGSTRPCSTRCTRSNSPSTAVPPGSGTSDCSSPRWRARATSLPTETRTPQPWPQPTVTASRATAPSSTATSARPSWPSSSSWR